MQVSAFTHTVLSLNAAISKLQTCIYELPHGFPVDCFDTAIVHTIAIVDCRVDSCTIDSGCGFWYHCLIIFSPSVTCNSVNINCINWYHNNNTWYPLDIIVNALILQQISTWIQFSQRIQKPVCSELNWFTVQLTSEQIYLGLKL